MYIELRICKNENSVKSFSHADNVANILEKLFSSTLNRIAVCVWYVSFTLAVLHAGLNNQLFVSHANK